MPCLHKFHEYLTLQKGYVDTSQNELGFAPTTLIVGTFNPSWPIGNQAEWFYGRVRNNYVWDVLPRLFDANINLRQGRPEQWREFCAHNGVALTDIITSINDAVEANEEHQDILRTYLDTSIADYFDDFTFTDVVGLLDAHPTIQNIYLTRQKGVELFDQRWELVEEYGRNHPERNLHIRKLMTPSASARFQIGPYKLVHPNDPTPLRNFIYECWRNEWH